MKTLLVNRLSHVLEVVFKEIKLCYYRIDQVTKEEYVRCYYAANIAETPISSIFA